MSRIQELEQQIVKYRSIYYNATPEEQELHGISDAEYDLLEQELKTLDPNNFLFQKVGAEVGFEGRLKLVFPMLSQEKALTEQEALDCFNRFDKSSSVVLTEKLDGAGLDICYKNGVLNSVITRGDWESGTDVTFAARLIPSIPKEIKVLEPVHVRGEVVITKADFEEVNKNRVLEGEKEFSNSRNLAAGSVKLTDKEEIIKRKMSFVAYEIFTEKSFFSIFYDGVKIDTYMKRLLFLSELGFETPVTQLNYSTKLASQALAKAYSLLENDNYPYCIDGIVIRENNISISEGMGQTTHHWKMSFAVKPKPEAAWVEIDHIDWTMSRAGILTPTAVFNPVMLSGANIGRAQLFNLNNLKKWNACKGTKVKVVRSGLVIPRIVDSDRHKESILCATESLAVEKENELNRIPAVKAYRQGKEVSFINYDLWMNEIPEKDPLTGALVKQVFLSSEGALVLKVVDNDTNYKTIAKKIEFFLKANRILGWGEVILEEYCLNNNISSMLDFFQSLSISKIKEGIKSRSISDEYASKLFNSVKSRRILEATSFLKGLGISRVQESAKDIVKNSTSVEDLFNLDIYKKVLTPGVYSYVVEDFKRNLSEYEEMSRLFIVEFLRREESTTKLSGKVFVITGTLSKPRNDFKKIIEQNGGKVGSSVSSKTDYLLAGEDCGSKLNTAKSLGVSIITEEEFNKML